MTDEAVTGEQTTSGSTSTVLAAGGDTVGDDTPELGSLGCADMEEGGSGAQLFYKVRGGQ